MSDIVKIIISTPAQNVKVKVPVSIGVDLSVAKQYTDEKVAELSETLTEDIAGALAEGKEYTDEKVSDLSEALTESISESLDEAKEYSDSLVVGLWDDRGNYNPATNSNQYPSAGGSGSGGALKKGDIFTIAGLGNGVTALIGTKTVQDGDNVRVLTDTPGQTEANWAIGENNIGYAPENSTNKDASGGYAGLTLFKINFKNVLNSFTSFFTNSNTGARTYTFQDKDGTIADLSDLAKQAEVIQLAASDETTALTTGTKLTFRMPYAMTLSAVRASLTTAQGAGSIFTVDIKAGGVTIFSTKPTIDNGSKTTVGATTPSVLSVTALTDDQEMEMIIHQVGDGTGKGLKFSLIGTRT